MWGDRYAERWLRWSLPSSMLIHDQKLSWQHCVVAADVLGLPSSMWFIGVQPREMFWLQELRADSVD